MTKYFSPHRDNKISNSLCTYPVKKILSGKKIGRKMVAKHWYTVTLQFPLSNTLRSVIYLPEIFKECSIMRSCRFREAGGDLWCFPIFFLSSAENYWYNSVGWLNFRWREWVKQWDLCKVEASSVLCAEFIFEGEQFYESNCKKFLFVVHYLLLINHIFCSIS